MASNTLYYSPNRYNLLYHLPPNKLCNRHQLFYQPRHSPFFSTFFFSRVIRSFVRVLGLLLPRGIVVGKKPVYAALDPILDWSELKFGEEPLQLVIAGLRHVTGGVTSCMPPS